MTAPRIYFSGEAASYNILEQNVILEPRFLEDDDREMFQGNFQV